MVFMASSSCHRPGAFAPSTSQFRMPSMCTTTWGYTLSLQPPKGSLGTNGPQDPFLGGSLLCLLQQFNNPPLETCAVGRASF